MGDNALTSENALSHNNLRAHSPQTAGDSRPQPDTPIGLEESWRNANSCARCRSLAAPSRRSLTEQGHTPINHERMFVEADPEPKTHVTCGMTHPIIVRWLEHRQVRRPHAQPMIGGRDLPIHPLAYLGPVIPAWSASQTYVELAGTVDLTVFPARRAER